MKLHPVRYIAKIEVEAETPLAVSSGRDDVRSKRLLMRDANGLPYIPGTGLAGALRAAFERKEGEKVTNDLLGFQSKGGGIGSRLYFTAAHLRIGDFIAETHKDVKEIPFVRQMREHQVVREHVRINRRGVAADKGKFDSEVLYKGCRFAFQLELEGTKEDTESWNKVLAILQSPTFRIGGGTRKGWGKLKVLQIEHAILDLENPDDLNHYLTWENSLNKAVPKSQKINTDEFRTSSEGWVTYNLKLKPKDFFRFGAEPERLDKAPSKDYNAVDDTPTTERVVIYDAKGPRLEDRDYYLIPATSIKGALAHRFSYHYNRLNENLAYTIEDSITEVNYGSLLEKDFEGKFADLESFATKIEALKKKVEIIDELEEQKVLDYLEESERLLNELTEANIEVAFDATTLGKVVKNKKEEHEKQGAELLVKVNRDKPTEKLFGSAKDAFTEDSKRGHLLMEDLYLNPQEWGLKQFNHVLIDRFTGGAKDGALFSEKVLYAKSDDAALSFSILLDKDNISEEYSAIEEAWEATLDDLVEGRLPLGAAVNRGHGVFLGTYEKEEQ